MFDYWAQEALKVRSQLPSISDRSRLFGPDIRQLQAVFENMERTRREGLAMLEQGDRRGAWGRLEALWLALPVYTLHLNYLILLSHAEDAGMLSSDWGLLIRELDRRTAPALKAMVGYDSERIRQAARIYGGDLNELDANLPKLQKALLTGGDWSRKALFVTNGITLAIGAHQALRQIGSLRGIGPNLTWRFPGLVSTGGAGQAALSSGVVVIPAEVLESLRRLVEIGALSHVVLSAGAGVRSGTPEFVKSDGRFAMGNDSGPTKSPGQQNPDAKSQGVTGAAKGGAPGSRPGQPFTMAGKKEVWKQNASKHGGVNKCDGCGAEVVKPQRHTTGVTPPRNEGHIDHVEARAKGGSGTPENGQVLCRDCNLEKGIE